MDEGKALGKWTEERLTALMQESSGMHDPGERVSFLSGHFINTPYRDSTLTGGLNTREVPVINLEGVDCFTFIEYIESMRRSTSFAEFAKNLISVRYRGAEIAFPKRNHFFTDWKAFNAECITDVTRYMGAEKIKEVSKRLNEKEDGTHFLPGVPCRLREVAYIQSIYVDKSVIAQMKTGDYVGIYSKKEGLDVSHVGILIKNSEGVKLRHASSLKKHRKVIDEEFRKYLRAKPGIIVLRART